VTARAHTRRELILIVDDDPAIRTSLAELLGDCGYDTLTECDGTTALDLLDSLSPSEDQPSVMLVDVMMPEMDGYTFAFASRCRPSTASVPVILMSAFNPTASGSMPHYIHDFLPKPLKLDRLMTAVRAAVRARAWSCN